MRNTTELEFKVTSFRKIPNPYSKEDSSSISEMYTAICDVKDIPAELLDWMETNPREQNIRSGVAKKIKESLISGHDFHLLNRGILISAQDVRYNNYDDTMKVVFSDETVHGNVDGGHTLRVILENRDNVEAGQQYVKLEILTGVEGIFEDLAAARNTSTQVQDKSIANLRGQFKLIKEVIESEEFRDRVYFMENDDGDIDVGDILAILNLFNIDRYKGRENCPIISCSSRKKCIDLYIEMYETYGDKPENPYVKMKPIMLDFFKLYDRLEVRIGDYYRQKVPSGKYGSSTGVTTAKDNEMYQSKFYHNDTKYRSPLGFMLPILGALRALVREKDGVYTWLRDPYEILDKVAPELVLTTVERSRTLGNNPAKTGKDSGNWSTLFMAVGYELTSF